MPKTGNKLCPLKLIGEANGSSECEGENCACYIKLVKPRYAKTEKYTLVDHEYFYRYAGCGLVHAIPWELVERERKPKTEMQQAEEAYAKLEAKP